MGVFYIDGIIENPRSSTKRTEVKKLLVDTSSEFTWVPEEELKKASIVVRKKDVPFVMASGMWITRCIGYAIVRCGTFETVDEVVFGQPGDLKILGSRTLEGFGAEIDPRRKRLVAAGPLPVAAA